MNTNTKKRIAIALACAAATTTANTLAREALHGGATDVPADGQAKVQLAILLDTSGSMSGLIEQTKTQLWQIVNTFIGAKQDGRIPYVEVALYEYGNDGLNPENYWVRQIQPLTRDLDQISEDLFSLTTNGGSEFCGAVITRATTDLAWDPSPDVYKAVFVAGNEPFTQGPVDPANACKDAIAKGVIVNTIHCGTEADGLGGGWKAGAVLADGKFLVIDHDKAVVHVEAPQDAAIVGLNADLNSTYIPVGSLGAVRLAAQSVQDANADANKDSGALLQRVLTKASVNYCNSHWDLVDACAEKDFDWAKVKDEDLPEPMRGLSVGQKQAFVAAKRAERAEIQQKIQTLNAERDAYVKAELENRGDGSADTLDTVVVNTVKEQAAEKGYQFDD
ncbi:MAG TPA: vWA domain-containing protein [Methylomirabilota bacterium]|nr:vWA domain-containing protein [Methylomirabilota bacterium]